MQKIFLINTSQDFQKRMGAVFNKAEQPFRALRSRECFFSITETGSIELFSTSGKVELEDSRVFLRLRGKDTHFKSLISKVCLKQGVPINDHVFAEHTESENKVSQMILLALEGVRIPKTVICRSESFTKNREALLERIHFPCILKTGGSRGSRVWKVKNEKTLINHLFNHNELFLIQEYVPNSFDIRVLVYEGEILGAIKRTSTDGFYNNVSKGGTVDAVELSDEEVSIAQKSALACGIDFAGVDIVRSERGPLVLEVNHGPQIGGFETQTGLDVPGEIARRMLKN